MIRTAPFGADLTERPASLPTHRDWEQRACNPGDIAAPMAIVCPRADYFGPVVTESIVVDPRRLRTPVLVIYYNRYLTNSDYAMFMKRVARRYSNHNARTARLGGRPRHAPGRRARAQPDGRLLVERRARPGARRPRPRRANHRRERHPRVVVPRRHAASSRKCSAKSPT